MKKVVLSDQVPFESVDWGLTKNLVGPKSTGAKQLKVNITEYLPGCTHKLHVHPTQEEVIFVLSGRGYSETEAGRTEIGPGTVVFIPAGVAHATYNASDTASLTAVIIKSPPGDEEVRL